MVSHDTLSMCSAYSTIWVSMDNSKAGMHKISTINQFRCTRNRKDIIVIYLRRWWVRQLTTSVLTGPAVWTCDGAWLAIWFPSRWWLAKRQASGGTVVWSYRGWRCPIRHITRTTASTVASQWRIVPESFQQWCTYVVLDEVNDVNIGAMLKTRYCYVIVVSRREAQLTHGLL